MFVGETEVRYVLDYIDDDVMIYEDMDVKLKSLIKKWIQTYNLQEAYPYIWEEVSTES